MSFGSLNDMLNKTQKIIENYNKITLQEQSQVKNIVYTELKKEYSDMTLNIVDELFNRLYTSRYILLKHIDFENGSNSFRELDNLYQEIEVPPKYKKLYQHFCKLKNFPQPVQRSKEWFDYRYNRITASDTAAAIDLNPYEPVESFILKKCDPNFPFRDNEVVFHGRKYEPIATAIYEHIYNTNVTEFGALPSEKYSFLGASPDGICSKVSLDNTFSKRLGVMLEIKCPYRRVITTKGDIVGEICPFYYYCQVQQQLVCCELNYCDFWQCNISEYKTRNEYLADDCKNNRNTIGTEDEEIDIDNRIRKGLFLEFFPKSFTPIDMDDNIEWKGKYIMPKRLDMDEGDYDNWVVRTLDNYKTTHPELYKDYYFNKIIYWKLKNSHNVTIPRDDKFFDSIIPILKDTWAKVVYYRNNQDKLEDLKKIVEHRKNFKIKINSNYVLHNDELVKNKILFLNDDSSFKVKQKVDPSEYINFVD
jgi:putative phage-type endonuclease